MKLSAHILCGDCAATITKCLSSIKADEIICVVDKRHSNHEEVFNLCELHSNTKVYYFDWPNDSFSEARNFALDKCSGDFNFHIDADEVMEGEIYPPDDYDYMMCQVWKDGELFYYPRVYRKGLRFKNYARHNEIDFSGLREVWTNKARFIGITTTTPEERISKTQALLKRHFKQLEEEDNPTLNFRIANCYKVLGDMDKCLIYSHLALTNDISSEAYAQACLNLYMGYYSKKEYYAANRWLELSIKVLPEQRQARMLLYEDLMNQKQYEEASKVKEQVLNLNFSVLPLDILPDRCNEIFKHYEIKLNQNEEIQV